MNSRLIVMGCLQLDYYALELGYIVDSFLINIQKINHHKPYLFCFYLS